MLEDPRKRKDLLPPAVTTGTGSYTAGTPVPSRTAPRAATPVTRVDLPFLEPAAPVTKYRQSNVQADRTGQRRVAPAVASPSPPPNPPPQSRGGQDGGRPGTALVPAAQAASAPVRTTRGASSRYFQAPPPRPPVAPAVAPAATPWPAVPAPASRPRLTQQAVQSDLAQPGSLPLLPGQGYFRNNTTGQIATFDSPPQQQVTRAAPALAVQPGQPEQAQRRVVLPRLNTNLSTSDAIADFISQAATAGETIAANRQAVGTQKRAREPFKDEREAFQGDLTALKTLQEINAPPTLEQVKASRAQRLLKENPVDFSATDRLLFGDRSSTNRRIIQEPVVDAQGVATGAKRFHSVDPETGQAMPVELAGAKSAQGGGRPADYPDAFQGRTPDGKPGWLVKREGKTYLVSE